MHKIEGSDVGPIDLDRTTITLEPEQPIGGGLHLPGKDRVVYRRPEKSRLGLDVLAIAQRGASKADGAFKVPREGSISVAASANEEETSALTEANEDGSAVNNSTRTHGHRRYRDAATSEASQPESNVTQAVEIIDGDSMVHSSRSVRSEVSSRHNRDDGLSQRRDSRNEFRSKSKNVSHRHSDGIREKSHGKEHDQHEKDYREEYGRKRGRYEGSRRTPVFLHYRLKVVYI